MYKEILNHNNAPKLKKLRLIEHYNVDTKDLHGPGLPGPARNWPGPDGL
jgi:hypothetical protein